jgi:hypothetical protein
MFHASHKKFVLVTKLLDVIVENILYADGIDFYNRGLNIAYSNLFYYLVPARLGEAYFTNILNKFQRMCRLRTRNACDDFFRFIFQLRFPQDIEDIFLPFKEAYRRFQYGILEFTKNHSLEISTSCAFVLAAHWSEFKPEGFKVIHDYSNNMKRIIAAWQKVTSADVPRTTVGQDRRKMTFPIAVLETRIESSREWAGLQIADIFAGALTRYLRWIVRGEDSGDIYAKELSEVINVFAGHRIWPEPKFTPEELGTLGSKAVDAVEFISSLLEGQSL